LGSKRRHLSGVKNEKDYFFLLTLVFASGVVAESQEALRAKVFNTDKDGFALHGYDPVSYHQGQPQKGKTEFSTLDTGIRYRFASQINLDAFLADPARYEPAYGGMVRLGHAGR
jgi:YHS domain-containing protein